jgi:hypothetical protein
MPAPVAGVVVCAAFFVCWFAFVVANLLQIRAQRTLKKQAIKYYLSRMSAVLAVGMCMDTLATFLDYQLVGEAFRAMMSFGTVMQTIMTHVALVMLSIASYQALLVAHTLKVVVVSEEASSLKRRFFAINVVSFVWSTVVLVIMLVQNRRWLLGLVKVMWAVVIALLLVSFWYYLSAVIRTARTTAKSLGVTWVRHSVRKPVISTVFTSVIAVGLLGSGALELLLDREQALHPASLEAYIPVNELMLLLACSITTYYAWLPLQHILGSETADPGAR